MAKESFHKKKRWLRKARPVEKREVCDATKGFGFGWRGGPLPCGLWKRTGLQEALIRPTGERVHMGLEGQSKQCSIFAQVHAAEEAGAGSSTKGSISWLAWPPPASRTGEKPCFGRDTAWATFRFGFGRLLLQVLWAESILYVQI
jgi:hypothetical protein